MSGEEGNRGLFKVAWKEKRQPRRILRHPTPRPCVTIRNKQVFQREELLAPRSTPTLEDHPLSAVRNCLFSVFTVTLYI